MQYPKQGDLECLLVFLSDTEYELSSPVPHISNKKEMLTP